MRHSRAFFLICVVGTATAGGLIAASQNSLADFGINEIRLKQGILSALFYGNVPLYPSRKLYDAAAPTARAAFAKNTLAFVKAYTESTTFKADYAKRREEATPKPSAAKGSPDEQFAQYRVQQQKSLDEFKGNLSKMTPEMQKTMAPVLKQLEENVRQANTDKALEANMKQMYQMQSQTEAADYQRRVVEFEKRYPRDPNQLIADRLREFLELSKDVNFSAKLAPASGGKMRFVDAAYENKPEHWKLCFRAGKEPVEAARAFVGEWLKQIEKK